VFLIIIIRYNDNHQCAEVNYNVPVNPIMDGGGGLYGHVYLKLGHFT